MCCNPTVCFKFQVIKLNFCCNSTISQLLPNFKTQSSEKEEVGSYDNIALKQQGSGDNARNILISRAAVLLPGGVTVLCNMRPITEQSDNTEGVARTMQGLLGTSV